MREREQRGSLAFGGDEVRVDGRVVPAVHHAVLARPGHVARDGDRARVGGATRAGADRGPGPVRGQRGQLGRAVGAGQHHGGPGATGSEAVGAHARVGDRDQLAAVDVEQTEAGQALGDDEAEQPALLVPWHHRVRALPEHPLRLSELGLGLVQRADGGAVVEVEVPPAGAVRGEQQVVPPPARLDRRLVGAAGDRPRVAQPVGTEPCDAQGRGVPGHVRVVPLGPGEPSVIGQLGRGVEVGTPDQHGDRVEVVRGRPVEGDGDDRRDGLPVLGDRLVALVLADRDDEPDVPPEPVSPTLDLDGCTSTSP